MEIGTTKLPDWRAAVRTEELERTYWRRDLDVAAWPQIALPHQWAVSPGFEETRGPVVYRTDLELPPLAEGLRGFVRAPGVFYFTHFWMDEVYLGDRAGYFLAQEVECSEQLRDGTEHCLALEVECPDQHDASAKTIVTGVFSHWDAIDPEFNPGGPWLPIEIRTCGPVRIDHALVIPLNVSPRHAQLAVDVGLDAAIDGPVRVSARLYPEGSDSCVAGFERTWTVPTGASAQMFRLDVENPDLWWPHSLGDQPLYRLEVDVVGPDGTSWDRAERTVGIRTVAVEDWIFTVNGERMFVRGSNYAPTRHALSLVTETDVQRDMDLAKEANLDLLRVHAHVGHPSLYAAADAAGIILWQDFPLQWGYSRRVKKSALDQARGMVHMLGSHPSVALWCCHNEPLAVEITDVAELSTFQTARIVASALLPTWNKNVLDPALRRAVEEADPSRFCNEKSGEVPNTLSYGTDTHLYFGWYMPGSMRRFERLIRMFPRMSRFLSEYGAQAFPSAEAMQAFVEGDWPNLDWEHLRTRHSLQPGIMDRWVPRSDHADLASYRDATQTHQADVIKYHTEILRRLKYEPCGGYTQFQFNDSYPSVTWSVVDHLRNRKAGFEALRAASAPVLVMADWPAASYDPAGEIRLDLWVVSELRRPLAGLRLTAHLDGVEHEWGGDVPADSTVRVGCFEADAPAQPGTHTLSLLLSGIDGDVVSANAYPIVVT
ncbi:MAG: hypothetical protein IT198_09735 [Acidimicrobiia bacterium]|nr:hypothetical protein [Acidimicrobiia bacterium]